MTPVPAPGQGEGTVKSPEVRTQLRERFEQIARDIFALEINMVLKANMTATPWPGPAHGLLDVASEYEDKLIEIQERLEHGAEATPELGRLGQIRGAYETKTAARPHNFASVERFDQLRDWANALCPLLQARIADARASGGPAEDFERASWMAARIRENSDQLKGVLGRAGKRRPLPEITRENADEVDLGLAERDSGTLRKIWEIGTEEVVAQTVIHLDGDVVMRVQPAFATPEGQQVLQMHNATVQTAIRFWETLIGVISAGLKWLVGK